MDHTSPWDTEDWLESARNLVSWANSKEPEYRIMLLVRHSHREEIVDHSKQLSTGLTELGKKTSYEMGKRLSSVRPAHIFFSFVSRCYATAEELAKGFTETGGRIIDMDPLSILVTPEIYEESVWENLQPDGRNITDYVNNWGDGKFGDMIEEFDQYKVRLLSDTIKRLLDTTENQIHIHITHDLALMASKRIMMQRAIGYEDREPFLGGIGMSIDEQNQLALYCAGHETKIALDCIL